MSLKVRLFIKNDIPLLVNYWISSSDQHLENMGVDISKIPDKITLKENLLKAIKNKQSFCLIWEYNNIPIGHTNANKIIKGEQANMHLHLWQQSDRQKGLGLQLIKKSLPLYFDSLNIETLICEPFANNPAPNKILKKIGFKFIKKYTTIPGSINFEQEVNQWKLTRQGFNKLNL